MEENKTNNPAEQKAEAANGYNANDETAQSNQPKRNAGDNGNHGESSQRHMTADERKEEKRKLRKKAVKKREIAAIFGIILFALVVGGVALWGLTHLKPADETIQGQADCDVVRVSGKLPGRVVEFYVKEGDYVKRGQRLAKIYSSTAEAALNKATAMEDVASSQNQKAENGTRDELKRTAKNMVDQAKAAEEIMRKTYERMENLYKEGVISEQKRDEAKAAYEAASAQVRTAQSQLDLANNGAQKEDKAAAKGMKNAAHAQVQEVQSVLEDQYLIAPCDGEVSSIYPHEGELVGLGSPIMTISKLDEMWVSFNVREEKLNDMNMGSEWKALIPALGNKEVTMKVYHVHDMGSYATWNATKSYGEFDSKTFEVKARPVKVAPGLRPGMSVIKK